MRSRAFVSLRTRSTSNERVRKEKESCRLFTTFMLQGLAGEGDVSCHNCSHAPKRNDPFL